MKKITKEQEKFIVQTILSNTQSSSFQRGCVYVKKISKRDKRKLVIAFHEKLRSLEKIYRKEVFEKDHIENIEKFKDGLSKEFPAVLRGKKMRFGPAQKAVNLYLKFLWCRGYIEMPPHCPIDGIVLTKVGSNIKWTELDDVEEYKKIIELIRARAKAGKQSIAEWELDLWQSKRDL